MQHVQTECQVQRENKLSLKFQNTKILYGMPVFISSLHDGPTFKIYLYERINPNTQ